jgi:hypothetical protein
LGAGEWSLALRRCNMSISIHTDHFLLDGHGLTINAFGFEISWIWWRLRPTSRHRQRIDH